MTNAQINEMVAAESRYVNAVRPLVQACEARLIELARTRLPLAEYEAALRAAYAERDAAERPHAEAYEAEIAAIRARY